MPAVHRKTGSSTRIAHDGEPSAAIIIKAGLLSWQHTTISIERITAASQDRQMPSNATGETSRLQFQLRIRDDFTPLVVLGAEKLIEFCGSAADRLHRLFH